MATHNATFSCWVAIHGKVYDMTKFVNQHPGGSGVILRHNGKDATKAFSEVHSPSILNELPLEACLGPYNSDSSGKATEGGSSKLIAETIKSSFPHLTLNVVTTDFEAIAKPLLSEKAYIYGSSGSGALQALTANAKDWSRITFLPRVLRDVSSIDLSSSILGHKVRLPIFITPMGLMGMFHGDGEVALSKAAKRHGVGYVVSNATSKDHSEIVQSFDARSGSNDEGALFFQFYVPTDRKKAIATIIHARELGYKGLFITVDTPAVGKRVADRRLQASEKLADGFADSAPKAPAVTAGGRAASGFLSSSLCWEDIRWMRKEWPGPIVVKGIQTAADAKIAADIGLQGIYLSNHGGRQLGSAPSAVRTLENIRLQCPEVFGKLEVFVDGGVRSGEDVLKALCLGAKAVGVGRPFMWALAAYGHRGAARVIDILEDEMEHTMRLLGARNVSELGPELVIASKIGSRL